MQNDSRERNKFERLLHCIVWAKWRFTDYRACNWKVFPCIRILPYSFSLSGWKCSRHQGIQTNWEQVAKKSPSSFHNELVPSRLVVFDRKYPNNLYSLDTGRSMANSWPFWKLSLPAWCVLLSALNSDLESDHFSYRRGEVFGDIFPIEGINFHETGIFYNLIYLACQRYLLCTIIFLRVPWERQWRSRWKGNMYCLPQLRKSYPLVYFSNCAISSRICRHTGSLFCHSDKDMASKSTGGSTLRR